MTVSLSEAIGAYERGDYQKSRDLCREVLSPDLSRDDCAMAHAYLGHSLAKLGDQAGANEQFRRALSLEKKRDGRLHLHYVLGIGFRKLGDLEPGESYNSRSTNSRSPPPRSRVRNWCMPSLHSACLSTSVETTLLPWLMQSERV
jgi:tetratricopeptide (TPR) repeat protein